MLGLTDFFGARLVSLCSGAFILGETGLVDGLSVATHQICAEAMAKRFPQIVVDTNRRIIDHGDIVTAGRMVILSLAAKTMTFTAIAPRQPHQHHATMQRYRNRGTDLNGMKECVQ